MLFFGLYSIGGYKANRQYLVHKFYYFGNKLYCTKNVVKKTVKENYKIGVKTVDAFGLFFFT